MVDVVNTVGASAGAVYNPQPSRTPVASADNTTTSFDINKNYTGTDATKTSATTTETRSLPPRFLDDPTAGILVTQNLDSEGQIVTQTPSSSVLAYLRNGLTIEGYPKQSTTA